MWTLIKGGHVLICMLRDLPIGDWELRLELDGAPQRFDACQRDDKVWKLAERWYRRARRNGWMRP